MAIFLTPKTKENMTAGERRFAGIMDLHLNDDYLIWYNIPSRNKRRYPDFLIFNPHIGLICLEIKDWSYSSLRSINSDTVTIQTSQGIRENTHPLKQARDILFDFVSQLTQSPQLRHKNSLKFPYAYGAVMVNLKRSDIPDEQKDSFERIFSSEKTLYHEDIHNNPQNLETFLKNLMPFHGFRSITSDDISQIRGNIFPELVLDRETIAIQSSENQNNITFAEHLKVMDLEQEKFARQLGGGHRVILDLTDEQNRLDLVNQKDRIILCTVHSSKGLEFKKVILCHCDKTQNMGAELSDADKSRILYIGMTRAQEELYMLAQRDNLWTQTIKKVLTAQKPSG
ncbi:MAG: 3'-5' exonuclease [Cardiobacteriaceae bacterium]|nr:3'-5' exonuclease [Cardiobacteriaceae bacterium]